MSIKKLKTRHFRNLQGTQISPGPSFNLLLGRNGSGKTSVLEAIYVLSYGRSFRSAKLATAIAYKEENFLSCAQISEEDKSPFYLGMLKDKNKRVQAKLSGHKIKSMTELNTKLPTLFISPDSFSLLVDGPEQRRKFIDWGAFHCQPGFSAAWQAGMQVLKQRNASLKQARASDLAAWDKDWIKFSQEITKHRKDYLHRLMPCFQKVLSDLSPQDGLRIDFWQGWSEMEPFDVLLRNIRPQEIKVGYSLIGPHRADLQISLYDYPASQLLSRGQQKMLVCALYLAQGVVLTQTLGKECIYLIDDLSSELDELHRGKFLQYLYEMEVQSFITGVEPTLLLPLVKDFPHKIYHVSKGVVTEQE